MKVKSIIAAVAFIFAMTTSALADHGHGGKDIKDAVKAVGVINAIDADNHKVNISHEPIKAIGWPAMKMDMKVMKSIDLSNFKVGAAVDFKLAKGDDGIYMIVDLHHRKGEAKMKKMDHTDMKHKDHKHD